MKTIIGYGAGHICNDIVNSVVNSYLMPFYQNVIGLQTNSVGMISLIGSLVGGISSPIIGYSSDLDADNWICNQYGRRKVGYL